ncbi:MAG: ABC transporter permease [Ktedonobacterales bacterium]|nr:ABC transporter permease [Ktedonobacterales bacterium]
MDTLREMLRFLSDPQNTFWQHTTDTLKLALVPTLLALLIALPLGVLVAQRPFVAFLVANLTGLVRAIPTLAVLAVMILYFKRIGFAPSTAALTALGVPPILLNTIAGLRGVDPAAVDAGRGMGMTARQVLVRIQLPLVLPVIAAGVRTAAVQIIATVPLAALIGGGGYGDYIIAGINLLEIPQLLVGAVAIALLAIVAELALAGVQRAVTPAGIRVGEAREMLATPPTPLDIAPRASAAA